MTRVSLSLGAAALILLGGCSALTGPREDFSIFALDPPTPASAGAPVDWQLLIEEPHVSDLLDGFRIVVAPSGSERQVFKGARWVERTPSMLQGIWLRSFESDGRLPGAARSGTGVRADLMLATDVTDFQATQTAGGMTVEVEVHARLVDPRDRRIRAREVFRAEVPASGNEAAAVVAGFESALAQINPSIVAWTLREGDRVMGERRAASE
jgi:cholesterol transport system auxiliary component